MSRWCTKDLIYWLHCSHESSYLFCQVVNIAEFFKIYMWACLCLCVIFHVHGEATPSGIISLSFLAGYTIPICFWLHEHVIHPWWHRISYPWFIVPLPYLPLIYSWFLQISCSYPCISPMRTSNKGEMAHIILPPLIGAPQDEPGYQRKEERPFQIMIWIVLHPPPIPPNHPLV